jgi:hypothetical protein
MDISQLFLSYLVSACIVSNIRKNSGVSKKFGGILKLERDKRLNGKKLKLLFVRHCIKVISLSHKHNCVTFISYPMVGS